jgi:catechol 2,3-dioxygenase-like lactoylglutathione lyase family enzyme
VSASLRRVTLLIGVREIELSLVFYRDILGLDVVARDDHHATLASEDGEPAVVLHATGVRGQNGARPAAPIARLDFEPRALEAIHSRLAVAGIPLRKNGRGLQDEFVARDLDGNEVVLRAEASVR